MQKPSYDTPRRVALVEDDVDLRGLTAALLEEEGFLVSAFADGHMLDAYLLHEHPDVLLLDVMLPGEDGLSICRRLAPNAPYRIMMLTARGSDIDRIVGLELGADDYLPKPFNPRELVARVRALLRRGVLTDEATGREIAEFLNWRLDFAARSLTDRDTAQEAGLSSGEFELLVQFVIAPGRVLSRDHLLDTTRGRMSGPFDRAIDVQVSKLRRKLGDDGASIIKTVRGGGYVLSCAVRRSRV
ncbi:response regulator [Ketogulonicigenium vulgare]|nr:response regulator [Ketogulonicigenium vulgare]ADO43614.1 two component transcriptional regulator [Ketogulonicigenium vulgare Y25]ALJ81989.1 two-component system response regulator [Ketogulonicigenium vulgare]ANW34628.1 DNA-binding response regulator [Ketogulonicigenium vulgare]AOZ55646.1 response regulator [Ketogulonicigenium vulgare]